MGVGEARATKCLLGLSARVKIRFMPSNKKLIFEEYQQKKL